MSYLQGGEWCDPSPYANTLTVSPSGGDYTSVKEALQNAVARDVIEVYPGIYLEDNPLPGVANVAVVAVGSLVNTRITAINANQDLFTSADAFFVRGCALANVTGTGWIVNVTDDHSVLFENIAIFQCEQGVRINNVDADLGLSECLVLSTGGVTLACGICNNAGNLTIAGLRVLEGASITTLFDFDGATGTTILRDAFSFEPGVGTMLSADNGGRVGAVGCSFAAMVDGVVAQGGATVDLKATSIVFAQQDGIRINDVGSGTSVFGYGLLVAESTRLDYNILSATALVSGTGGASFDKVHFAVGATMSIGLIDLKEGDEGFNVLGELHVGMPEAPTESVFGGGDSYTRGMIVYTYNPSGTVWTDVSVAAQSVSGSTFTFPALAQDNAIYVASSLQSADFLQHFGIKSSITTAAVLNGGEIVVEYWNGGAWVAINHMSTLANTPYTQHAKDIFERTGNEQIRYPGAFLSGWTKNDPGMGLGTNYYWIRYRVASAVTTVPVFQQFKLHTNRFEVNADGVSEYFGAGRYPRDLPVNIAISQPVSGASPGNAAIAFSATTTLTITRNQFNNNSLDAYGILVTIPDGLDTSIPLVLEDIWYADTTNAGNVELRAYVAQLEVGDLWDGSASEVLTAVIEAVGASTRYVSRKTSFSLDISTLVPGELIVLKVERDARGPNDPPDTLAGNIIHGSLRAVGTFWRP